MDTERDFKIVPQKLMIEGAVYKALGQEKEALTVYHVFIVPLFCFFMLNVSSFLLVYFWYVLILRSRLCFRYSKMQ